MSFCDLDGPAKPGRSSQPKQGRNSTGDSSFEREIKANIQEIQDGIRTATQSLERTQRSSLSIRTKSSLDKFLERSRQLVEETEQLFRDWTVHFAGEPMERHRKRPSFEKLQRAFEEEVAHLKEVASRYIAVQQDAALQPQALQQMDSVECFSMCDDDVPVEEQQGEQDHLLIQADLQIQSAMQQQMQQDEDAAIANRIVQERDEGIRRIQSQVTEVNQMFRDLASMVTDQGEELNTIDSHVETTVQETKEAVGEIRKAAKRQSTSRDNLCYMLMCALALLFFLVLPHMHFGGIVTKPDAAGDHVAVLRGSSGIISVQDSVLEQPVVAALRDAPPAQPAATPILPAISPVPPANAEIAIIGAVKPLTRVGEVSSLVSTGTGLVAPGGGEFSRVRDLDGTRLVVAHSAGQPVA